MLKCKNLLKKKSRKGEICGHEWMPRKLPVKRCPRCKSEKWNVTVCPECGNEYEGGSCSCKKIELIEPEVDLTELLDD